MADMADLETSVREHNDALADEIVAINAIYTPTTLVAQTVTDNGVSCVVALPSPVDASVRLNFLSRYPDERPIVEAVVAVSETMKVGSGAILLERARAAMTAVWAKGQECVDGWIDAVVEQYRNDADMAAAAETTNPTETPVAVVSNPMGMTDEELTQHWVLSQPDIVNKSVFIGRVASVSSPAQAKQMIGHLVQSNRRVAEATHNMTAWRIRGPTGTNITFQDCCDDGETAAGGRLLRLMQLADVWDMVVVVSRWYGGVKLGPDRFRIITNVARDALVQAGAIVPGRKQ